MLGRPLVLSSLHLVQACRGLCPRLAASSFFSTLSSGFACPACARCRPSCHTLAGLVPRRLVRACVLVAMNATVTQRFKFDIIPLPKKTAWLCLITIVSANIGNQRVDETYIFC